jgi:hypothetical protein
MDIVETDVWHIIAHSISMWIQFFLAFISGSFMQAL